MEKNILEKKRVCIVGGGLCGLAALRRTLESDSLTGQLFEQKDGVGGLWYYNNEKVFATSPRNKNNDMPMEKDPACVTTMYDNLVGNLPYPLMSLQDFSHNISGTFPNQKDMQNYAREYADHFKLWGNITLNTSVVNVRPETPNVPDGTPVRWLVETHNHRENTFNTEVYDAVILSVGKNNYPNEPKIAGIESFKGDVVHFKYFKNPDEFSGRHIVCIGLGPSSGDMAMLLSKTAKSVTICHKFPAGFCLGLLPAPVRETRNVKLITEHGVITEDDEYIACDLIMLCTGYTMKFPFMDESAGLEVIQGKYIPHLYKQIVFTKRPSLAVLNLCYRCVELVLTEIQSRFFLKSLEGKVQLPGYSEMEDAVKAEEDQKREKKIPYSLWFEIGPFGSESWKYFTLIADQAGFLPEYDGILKMGEVLFTVVLQRLFGKLALYKKDTFKMVNNTTWEYEYSTDSEFPDAKKELVRIKLEGGQIIKEDIVLES